MHCHHATGTLLALSIFSFASAQTQVSQRTTRTSRPSSAVPVAGGAAVATVVGFETDDDGTPLANGAIPAFGTDFSLESTGPNFGPAVFDSDPAGPNATGADPDLLIGSGNVLILQANGNMSSSGVFSAPDDAPDGGTLSCVFTAPKHLESVVLVDIDPGPGDQSADVRLVDSAGRVRTYSLPSGWTSDVAVTGTGFATLNLATLDPQPGFQATAIASQDPDFDDQDVLRFEVQFNGSGAIDDLAYSDPTPGGLGLSIVAGAGTVSFEAGGSANIASVISLENPESTSVQIIKSTQISPMGSVALTEDYPAGGYSASGDASFVLNQSFASLTPGEYTVTNEVEIVGESVSASETIVVQVIPPGGAPELLPLSSYPSAIAANATTNVVFTAAIANQVIAPDSVQLLFTGAGGPINVADLSDDGLAGDLVAGDGVYSGTVAVAAGAAGTLTYVAEVLFPGSSTVQQTPVYDLVVTSLPVGVAPSNLGNLIVEPTSGQEIVCDEILVYYGAPVDDSTIETLATNYGATVAGAVHGLGLYQLTVSNPNCDPGMLLVLADQIATEPGVLSAGPNPVASTQEVTPNDSGYSQQYSHELVRADELWTIARGGVLIAIVDSGVEYTHPDLSGKVLLGTDHINGDSDPMDDNGHGTHCAGIAAARSNNGIGVAGAAWESDILAIKSLNSAGKGPLSGLVAGMKEGADRGAKIVSCSFGAPPTIGASIAAWFFGLEGAVNYVNSKGALCVVAAGNESNTEVNIPGAYVGAFCVGSTDQNDNRSSFSCYGPEVDIAAPGTGIYSTYVGATYASMDGTSMATPLVAGCAALVWSRFPTLTASEVRARLTSTAEALPGLGLGAGRVDVFEAGFNGDFENDVQGWTILGTAGSLPSLGPIVPTSAQRMGFVSSGPDSAQVESQILQEFTIQPGVTSFALSFDYDFVTEEYPEWIGQGFNDNMRITLSTPGGGEVLLAFEEVDTSSFTAVSGIDFPGGDSTVGHTGWQSVGMNIPVSQGPGVYRIRVRDEGDGVFDSNVLIDNIRFRL